MADAQLAIRKEKEKEEKTQKWTVGKERKETAGRLREEGGEKGRVEMEAP